MSDSVKIIAECASGTEFYAPLAKNDIPDLVLLAIILPDTTGIEIACTLKTNHPLSAVGLSFLRTKRIENNVRCVSGKEVRQKHVEKNIFKKETPILTCREVEIVRCLCNGYPAKGTAEKLNMSVRTVERHKANILN